MPTYEFKCRQCRRKTSIVVQTYNPPSYAVCSSCGSEDTARVFSAFAYHRSESDRMAGLDTGTPRGDDYYRDSRNVGLWAKKRARELGVEGETLNQLDDVVDRAKESAKTIMESGP